MTEQEIYIEAMNRADATDRSRFLDAACGDQPGLRERLQKLIQHADHVGSFLERPPERLAATAEGSEFADATGMHIGAYKVRERIGEGGMGVVYVAQQLAPIRRKVALKIVKPGMATSEVVGRFEAERQALALMDHPNIAKVFDGGTTGEGVRNEEGQVSDSTLQSANSAIDALPQSAFRIPRSTGQPYFVMELVQGPPITEYCNAKRLTNRERLQLFLNVCRDVQHAHQKGIIHRDLKPTNVLVHEIDGAAVPKVIDFGVAKALHQKLTKETVYTHFSQMVGTPLYMSPEQAGLGVVDIDTRSDVYSLGVLLYELLTGSTPFDKESLQQSDYGVIRRILREVEPRRPSVMVSTLQDKALSTVAEQRGSDPRKLRETLSGELDWIVMKCLEKDRGRRYETASSLASDVQRYLAGEAVQACPPSKLYLLRKFSRKHRAAISTAAAILVVLTAGLAGTTWQAIRTSRAEEDALARASETEKERLLTERARHKELIARTDAERQRDLAADSLYLAHMRLAQRDWDSGQTLRLFSTLEKHVPVPGVPDRRGWEWYYLLSRCYESHNTLREHLPVWSVAWAPDGKLIAIGGEAGVLLWNPLHGQTRTEFHAAPASTVTWNPSGDRLAAVGVDGNIRVWDVATKTLIAEWPFLTTLRTESPAHTTLPRDLSWSTDGTKLAAARADRGVDVWEIDSQQHLRTIQHANQVAEAMAWHPNQRVLAVGGQSNLDHVVDIVDLTTGDVLASKSSPSFDVLDLAWSPDGSRLAVSFHSDTTCVWSFDGAELGDDWLLNHRNSVDKLAWSSNGRYLAAASREQQITVWDAKTGTKHRKFQGHLDRAAGVDWSPDDKYLVSCGDKDGTVRVWEISNTGGSIPVDSDGTHSWFRWRSDGRRLLAPVQTGWQVVTPDGENKLTIELPQLGSSKCCWSPDGEAVALCHAAEAPSAAFTVVNVRTGEKLYSSEVPYHIWAVSWSSNGKWLAIAYERTQVAIWDAERWEQAASVEVSAPASGLAFRPDGGQLAVGDFDGRITLFSANEWRPLGELRGHRGWIGHIAWSSDWRRIAAGGLASDIRVWDVPNHRELSMLAGHSSSIWSVSWHPDGQRLASASGDGTLRVWRVESGEELMVFQKDENGISAAWSPDGLKIATLRSGELTIHDASAGFAAVESSVFAQDRAMVLQRRAMQLASSGRSEEAEPLFQRVLDLRRTSIGDEHVGTLESVSDLALVYYRLGRYGDSQALLEESLVRRRRVLGNEHLRTLRTMENLAVVFGKQGRDADMEQLLRQVVEARRTHSNNDPSKLSSIRELMHVLIRQERFTDSYAACRDIPAICRSTDRLGDTLMTVLLNDYFAVCEAVGGHEEAKRLWEELLPKANWPALDDEYSNGDSADYRVCIDEPGEYQLYLRCGGHDGGSDSAWVALFDKEDEVMDYYLIEGAQAGPDIGDADADLATHSWETFGGRRRWTSGLVLEQPALFTVPPPGEYVIRLRQRETGFAIDTIVLQQSHQPHPGQSGPAESPRDASGAFVMQDGIVTIEAEHFSTAPPSWRVVPGDEVGEARHKNFRGSGYLLIAE